MTMLARLLAMLLLLTGPGLVAADPATAVGKPSAPRSVSAVPGDGSATMTWRVPARRGGSTIRRYDVQRRTGSGWTTVTTVSGRTLTWRATGLANGTSYQFRVRARGRSGWGRASAGVQVTPRTVPDAPGAPEADSYARALGVYWRAPASNGSAIDSYRVEVSANGTTWTTAADATSAGTSASPVMLTGLVPGTRYWLRIRAHNAAGFGEPSGTGPYTVRTPPGAPTGLSAVPDDGTVTLSWAPSPVDEPGETPAALYRVEQSTDDGATWTVAGEPTETHLVLSGLANGVDHLFRVSARSTTVRVGFGPASETVSTTPTGAPTAPTDLALAWSADQATYLLTWSPPASDGGSPVSHYLVEESPGSVTTQVDTPLTSSTPGAHALDHSYRVRACNQTGCGPWTDPTGPAGPPPYVLSVPADGVTLDEGTTTSFEVGLGFAALTDTVVSLASSDPSVSVDATVTVPAGSSSATVSVTATADEDAEDGTATITASLGAQQGTVAVAVHDTTQALVVDPSGPVDLASPGASAEVRVHLAFQPDGPVIVTLAYSGTKAQTSVTELTFDSGSWGTDQAFTITRTGNNETGTLTITTPGATPVQIQVST